MFLRQFLYFWVLISFIGTSVILPTPSRAEQSSLDLPAPGTMVNLTAAYQPVIIRGLTVHKDNPFLFDFIVDVGQDRLSGQPLKQEGEKLIKYFLASLAIPDHDVWVNLSPYEKNRMIPDTLGKTDMGRDLLEQDYILKQLTASLIYPEKDLGKKFWDRVYAKAQAEYGTTQIPVNTFNKVWIMADRAEVFEHNQTVFVVDSHLKVMLEEDYLALQKHNGIQTVLADTNRTHTIGSQIVREIVLPELEKEVNTGKNFANLRQIFNSIILANWYKNNLKQALLNQVYANKAKVKGIDLNDPTIKEQIYQQYLKAYKKGVFNYIKEDINTADGSTIPRKYFSGGIQEAMAANPAQVTEPVFEKAESSWKNDPLVDFATMASTEKEATFSGQEISRSKIKALLDKDDLGHPLSGYDDLVKLISNLLALKEKGIDVEDKLSVILHALSESPWKNMFLRQLTEGRPKNAQVFKYLIETQKIIKVGKEWFFKTTVLGFYRQLVKNIEDLIKDPHRTIGTHNIIGLQYGFYSYRRQSRGVYHDPKDQDILPLMTNISSELSNYLTLIDNVGSTALSGSLNGTYTVLELKRITHKIQDRDYLIAIKEGDENAKEMLAEAGRLKEILNTRIHVLTDEILGFDSEQIDEDAAMIVDPNELDLLGPAVTQERVTTYEFVWMGTQQNKFAGTLKVTLDMEDRRTIIAWQGSEQGQAEIRAMLRGIQELDWKEAIEALNREHADAAMRINVNTTVSLKASNAMVVAERNANWLVILMKGDAFNVRNAFNDLLFTTGHRFIRNGSIFLSENAKRKLFLSPGNGEAEISLNKLVGNSMEEVYQSLLKVLPRQLRVDLMKSAAQPFVQSIFEMDKRMSVENRAASQLIGRYFPLDNSDSPDHIIFRSSKYFSLTQTKHESLRIGQKHMGSNTTYTLFIDPMKVRSEDLIKIVKRFPYSGEISGELLKVLKLDPSVVMPENTFISEEQRDREIIDALIEGLHAEADSHKRTDIVHEIGQYWGNAEIQPTQKQFDNFFVEFFSNDNSGATYDAIRDTLQSALYANDELRGRLKLTEDQVDKLNNFSTWDEKKHQDIGGYNLLMSARRKALATADIILGPNLSGPQLVQIFTNNKKPSDVRRAAVRHFQKIPGEVVQAIGPLLVVLQNDKDLKLKRVIIEVLGSIEKSVQDSKTRDLITGVLINFLNLEVPEQSNWKDIWNIKRAAAFSLGNYRNPRATVPLFNAWYNNDKDYDLPEIAQKALLKSFENPKVIIAAREDRNFVKRLLFVASNRDSNTNKIALKAIGLINDPKADRALELSARLMNAVFRAAHSRMYSRGIYRGNPGSQNLQDIQEVEQEISEIKNSELIDLVVEAINSGTNWQGHGMIFHELQKSEPRLQSFMAVVTKKYPEWANYAMATDNTVLDKQVALTRGGIDLNTSNGMQWKDSRDGQGVDMSAIGNIDPAIVAQMEKDGVDFLSPKVLRMTQVTSVWALMGIKAPILN